MKPTKMRNVMIYRAANHTRSKQISSPLSKELQKKYGKRSVRIVEGDNVIVKRGAYHDLVGKVSKVYMLGSRIAIEGTKIEKSKGDKIDVLIHPSNVIVTSLNTDDSWRMSRLEGKNPRTNKKITRAKSDRIVDSLDVEDRDIDGKYTDDTPGTDGIDGIIDNTKPDIDATTHPSIEKPRNKIDLDIERLESKVDTDHKIIADSDISYADDTDGVDLKNTDTNDTDDVNDTVQNITENTHDTENTDDTSDTDSRSIER